VIDDYGAAMVGLLAPAVGGLGGAHQHGTQFSQLGESGTFGLDRATSFRISKADPTTQCNVPAAPTGTSTIGDHDRQNRLGPFGFSACSAVGLWAGRSTSWAT
jgi:hypothetical protein